MIAAVLVEHVLEFDQRVVGYCVIQLDLHNVALRRHPLIIAIAIRIILEWLRAGILL